MSTVTCEQAIVAVLTLKCSGQKPFQREIRSGQRLFVGADESSDICLIDDDVAATHCVIKADNGFITVQDCYSQSGTMVEDNRIREVKLTKNSEVRVGAAVITVTLNSYSPASAPRVTHAADPPSVKSEKEEDRHNEPTIEPGDDSTLQSSADLQWQLDQALAENEVLHSRLATMGNSTPASISDPFQEEMIALLRAEVMDLQTALSERDQSPAKQSHHRSPRGDDGEALSDGDSEKLVERLEQLLLELQERDDQIATLTELLEADETATRAERDERTQLDSWLKDIEERFGCREQEWQAQREKFQADIEAMAADRDRAEAAMNADSSSAKLEATQKVLVSLRDTAESQRLQLHEAEQTILELRRELELSRDSRPREEIVRLAEERADIARQRQELEASRQCEHRSGANEATLRLQALRQHLNEIHQQERQEQKEQDERKLSSRLARLWSRLEGR